MTTIAKPNGTSRARIFIVEPLSPQGNVVQVSEPPAISITPPITIYDPDYVLNPLPIGEYLPPGSATPIPQPPIRLATRGPISLRTRGRAPYTQTPADRTFNNINGTFFPVSGSQQ